ncbi:hypothetical protein [Crocosphaera subtropica]|uniref:hypothetical protein n=1 Tax=Crocosphaera subtropica TaxID=2546360 RepID=UPI0012EB1FC5|nr:hypothetical protein [Crocosphaera subtropica]
MMRKYQVRFWRAVEKVTSSLTLLSSEQAHAPKRCGGFAKDWEVKRQKPRT